MKKITLIFLALLALLSLSACSKKEESASGKMTRASATKAYEKYFGTAPTTDKGSCYAFVIYFPSKKEPGRVVPFPFFTFDEASLKRVALNRLVGGMGDVKSYSGEILQPFPQGSRIRELSEKGGVVTVNFSGEVAGTDADPVKEHALVSAVTLTLRQFAGVNEVRFLIDGKSGRLDKVQPQANESAILQPGPPRLLGVTGMKERGAKDVEEVDAFFDRPVDIKLLQITGTDGKPYTGDVYHSVFDMAAVLKPKDPAVFKAGMPLNVRWNVTDKLGRNGSGEGKVVLEVKEH